MTLVNILLVGGTSMIMMYTGLLFDPAWASIAYVRTKLRPFGGLALINYIAVPLLLLGMIEMFPMNASLALALVTLTALPCAPMVPAFISLAGEPPEWPLFVFLGFSLIGLAVVVILVAILANTAAYAANIGADTAVKLVQYALAVYGPMALGTALRFRAPATAMKIMRPVRALSGLASIAIFGLFATVHREEFVAMNQRDLLLVLGYVLASSLLGAIASEGFSGSRVTAIVSTGFRNIALGVAFATVVLRRPDVTAYMVIYSATTLCVSAAWLAIYRSARPPRRG